MNPYQGGPGMPPGYGYPQGPQPPAPQQNCGVELTTTHSPLQWMLNSKYPQLVVQGRQSQLVWGPQFLPFLPGQYSIEVFCPNWTGRSFVAQGVVVVYPGYITGVVYDTSSAVFIFQAVTLQQLGVKPWGR